MNPCELTLFGSNAYSLLDRREGTQRRGAEFGIGPGAEELLKFFSADNPVSSALTRERYGWNPQERGLLAEIERGDYFAANSLQ